MNTPSIAQVASTLEQYAARSLGGDLAKVKDYLPVAQDLVIKTHGVRLSFDQLRAVIDQRVAEQRTRGLAGHKAYVGQQTAGITKVNTGKMPINWSSGPMAVAQSNSARSIENQKKVQQALISAGMLYQEAQSVRDMSIMNVPANYKATSGRMIEMQWLEFEQAYGQFQGYFEQLLASAKNGGSVGDADLQNALSSLKTHVSAFGQKATAITVEAMQFDANDHIIRNMR